MLGARSVLSSCSRVRPYSVLLLIDEEDEDEVLAKYGMAAIAAPDTVPKGWAIVFLFWPGATNADGTSNSSSLLLVVDDAPGPMKDQGRAALRKETGERSSAERIAGNTGGKPGARGINSMEAAIIAQNTAAARQHDGSLPNG